MKGKSMSPCLLAIPAFDHIARLCNRHLNSNRGICLCQRFWSQAECRDWSCQGLGPRLPWTKYGRDKLWLVGWLSEFWAQTASFANWSYATFFRRLGEAAAPGRGECGLCPDFASYTLAFALQLRKNHGKNLSQGNCVLTVLSELDFFKLYRWPSCFKWILDLTWQQSCISNTVKPYVSQLQL